MEKVTFLQSLIKILKLISSIPFFIEILILTVFLLIIMIFFYFRKSKKGRITSLIIYFVTLCLLPISHFSFFVDTLDRIVENFVAIIYFPSCYVYIATLLITDFSILVNVIKNTKDVKKGKWYHSLDIIYFFLFQFLFFLIIRVVITEDIDIFTRTSLYSNANLTSLIQISSYLFWIRMGIKFIVFIIDRLSKFSFKGDKKEKNEIGDNNIPTDSDFSNESIKVNLNKNDTIDNSFNENRLTEFNNVSNDIVDSISEVELSQGNKFDNKVVKPLESIESDLFNINNYDDGNRTKNCDQTINRNTEKLEIDNTLYSVEPIQQAIKSPYDVTDYDMININKNTINDLELGNVNNINNNINDNTNIVDAKLEVLDLFENNDEYKKENNTVVPVVNLNKVDESSIETLDMNEEYSYQFGNNFEEKVFSTDSVDKINFEKSTVEKISPFDILKEAEQYVPISEEQHKVNNSVNLTIDNNGDDNDNYFDDFYE